MCNDKTKVEVEEKEDATALVEGMRRGTHVPVTVMRQHIDRLHAWDPQLCVAAHEMVDRALEQAARANPRTEGALACLPISLKGNLVCRGTPTHWGTAWSAGEEAQQHGEVVRRLVAAGGIPFVKSNVPQVLMLPETVNRIVGRTLHPTHHDRTCGGSSGAEAVLVALGISALGVGTDIGGSIRIPAAFCGVYGFKPTPGRSPVGTDSTRFARQEGIPTAAGPLTRSVRDISLAMAVLCHPHLPWKGEAVASRRAPLALRWGYWSGGDHDDEEPYFEPCTAQVRAVNEAAHALLGAGHRIRKLPRGPDMREITHLYFALMSAEGGMRSFRAMLRGERPLAEYAQLLFMSRVPGLLRPLLAWVVRRVLGEPRVADLLLHTGAKSVSEYFELLRQRRALAQRWRQWMDAEGLDVILLPATAVPAFRHGDSRNLTASFGTTFWANLLQCPAGVAPWTTVRADECRYRSAHKDRWARAAARTLEGAAGLPVGVQLLARPFQDEVCVAALDALARCRPTQEQEDHHHQDDDS